MRTEYGRWEDAPGEVRSVTAINRGLFGLPVRADTITVPRLRRKRFVLGRDKTGQQMGRWDWEYGEGSYTVG